MPRDVPLAPVPAMRPLRLETLRLAPRAGDRARIHRPTGPPRTPDATPPVTPQDAEEPGDAGVSEGLPQQLLRVPSKDSVASQNRESDVDRPRPVKRKAIEVLAFNVLDALPESSLRAAPDCIRTHITQSTASRPVTFRCRRWWTISLSTILRPRRRCWCSWTWKTSS